MTDTVLVFGGMKRTKVGRLRSWVAIATHREHALGAAALSCLVLIAWSASAMLRSEQMPDFRKLDAGEPRKTEFFDYLRPMIEDENARVLREREQLIEIAQKTELGWFDQRTLERFASDYALDHETMTTRELIDALQLRIDAVPISLALAQAAKESGWGTSRFARRGNNLFGEWCYDPGCGFVPRRRSEGRSHEVERFASPRDSVESYLRNINTHFGYAAFREERARLRESGKPLSGLALADALGRYSQRRDDYVEEIKRLIRFNDLASNSSGPDPSAR